MAKKPFSFDDLSTKKCKTQGCRRLIKKRLENERNHGFCFPCHVDNEADRGHVMKHHGTK